MHVPYLHGPRPVSSVRALAKAEWACRQISSDVRKLDPRIYPMMCDLLSAASGLGFGAEVSA
jgi:hypothetical protein